MPTDKVSSYQQLDISVHCNVIKNNTESLESGKLKKINIQKALPRIRSVQHFMCEIFRKTFYPDL